VAHDLAGAACAQTLCKAYLDAWKCDQLSAFGGIVALNKPLDAKTASAILRSGFLECVIAPGYDKGVIELFKGRKNLRLLELPDYSDLREMDFKRVNGGCLLQERDLFSLDERKLKVVTRKKPGRAQMKSLFFAWEIAKHVKSNAIVLAKGTRCAGIGAGQMSRVESVAIAAKKAGRNPGSCAWLRTPSSQAGFHHPGGPSRRESDNTARRFDSRRGDNPRLR
jgi:phosphoribosylaminoimidazolecarboxamide formyltransferase/IMP cyclohydrolase